MNAMSATENRLIDRAGRMKSKEREMAALAYLLAVFPLWGIVFDGIIWLAYRESNRRVIFHTHQAMALHFVMLLAFAVYCILGIVPKIVGVLDPGIAGMMEQGLYVLMLAVFGAYALTCLTAAMAILAGKDMFSIPILGPRLKAKNSYYR